MLIFSSSLFINHPCALTLIRGESLSGCFPASSISAAIPTCSGMCLWRCQWSRISVDWLVR